MAGREVLGLLATTSAAVLSGLPVILECQDLPDHSPNVQRLLGEGAQYLNLLEEHLSKLEGKIRETRPESRIQKAFPCSPHGKDAEADHSRCQQMEQGLTIAEREMQDCQNFLRKSREFLDRFERMVGAQNAPENTPNEEQQCHGEPNSNPFGRDEHPSRSHPSPAGVGWIGLGVSSSHQVDQHAQLDREIKPDSNKGKNKGKIPKRKHFKLSSSNTQSNSHYRCQSLQSFTAQVDSLRARLHDLEKRYCHIHGYAYGHAYGLPYALLAPHLSHEPGAMTGARGWRRLLDRSSESNGHLRPAIAAVVASTTRTASPLAFSSPERDQHQASGPSAETPMMGRQTPISPADTAQKRKLVPFEQRHLSRRQLNITYTVHKVTQKYGPDGPIQEAEPSSAVVSSPLQTTLQETSGIKLERCFYFKSQKAASNLSTHTLEVGHGMSHECNCRVDFTDLAHFSPLDEEILGRVTKTKIYLEKLIQVKNKRRASTIRREARKSITARADIRVINDEYIRGVAPLAILGVRSLASSSGLLAEWVERLGPRISRQTG